MISCLNKLKYLACSINTFLFKKMDIHYFPKHPMNNEVKKKPNLYLIDESGVVKCFSRVN